MQTALNLAWKIFVKVDDIICFMHFQNSLNTSGLHDEILPVNALVITVKGLARYNLPGPDLP
jgi:hypothetical protein